MADQETEMKAQEERAPVSKNAEGTSPAKTPRSGSKSETVIALLTQDGGTTRKEIVQATGWKVDLKQFAARKGLVISQQDGRLIAVRG